MDKIYSTTETQEEQHWRPRHFYILENKTSGKLYIGQTVKTLEYYRGSGLYWKAHNEKHGGYTRENITVLWSKWFTDKDEAKTFLDDFESEYPEYWLTNEWANLVSEEVDSVFYPSMYPNIIEKMSEASKRRWAEDDEYRERCLVGLQKLRESEGNSERLREITSALWQDEEYRNKVSQGHDAFWNSEEGEERKRAYSEMMIELWQDDEYRERCLVGLQKLRESEGNSERLRGITTALWQDEGYRNKVSQGHDAFWNSEEGEERRAEAARKMEEVWTREEYRELWKSSIDDYWSKEENHEACSEKMKKQWENNPHLHQQVSEKMKAHWNDPENRKRRLESNNAPKGKDHYKFSGYYHTPFGTFVNPDSQDVLPRNTIRRWCENGSAEKLVSKLTFRRAKWFQDNFNPEDEWEIVDKKSFRDLGFWFEPVDK